MVIRAISQTSKKQRIIIAVGILVVVLLSLFSSRIAGALGIIYFDDDGSSNTNCDVFDRYGNTAICNSAEIRLITGQTKYVKLTGSVLRVYFNSRAGQLTVDNINWCPGTAFGDSVETEDNDQDVAQGELVTRLVVPGVADLLGYRYKASDARCNDAKQVTFAASSLRDGTGIGMPGKWYVDIELRHEDAASGYDGIQNAMSVRLTSGAGYVSSGNDFLIAPLGERHGGTRGTAITLDADQSPANYALKVHFRADCDFPRSGESTNQAITFYDIDNGGGSGAQLNGKVRVKLRGVTPAGAVRWWYGGSWVTSEPPFANAYAPPDAQNVYSNWNFAAGANWHYELQILNIYSNNTIQVSTPFDNIPPNVDCILPEARVHAAGSWNISEVEAGQSAVFSPRIGNNSGVTGLVDDGRRMVWYDNGDGAWGAGDLDIVGSDGAGPGARVINSDVTIPNGGRDLGVSSALGNATYDRMCGRVFSVVASNPATRDADTRVTIADTGAICIPIAPRYPAFTVLDGDIQTGGTFSSGVQGACTLSTPPLGADPSYRIRGRVYTATSPTPPTGAARGSYTQYGAFAAGPITGFGSLRGYYSGSGTASSRGLFGTRGFDPIGAVTAYGGEGYFLGGGALPAGTETHCLRDVASLYPAPGPSVDLTLPSTPQPISTSALYTFPAGGGRDLVLCSAVVSGACASGGIDLPADGQKIVVRVTQADSATTNDIIINGSVRYPTSFASIDQLPQLVIVADKPINIKFKSVTSEFNGLVSTPGNIFTCEGTGQVAGQRYGIADTGMCPNVTLYINGATIAGGSIYPFRSNGFAVRADSTTFAERFRLSPEFLLSDYVRSKSKKQLRVQMQEELPSRF